MDSNNCGDSKWWIYVRFAEVCFHVLKCYDGVCIMNSATNTVHFQKFDDRMRRWLFVSQRKITLTREFFIRLPIQLLHRVDWMVMSLNHHFGASGYLIHVSKSY